MYCAYWLFDLVEGRIREGVCIDGEWRDIVCMDTLDHNYTGLGPPMYSGNVFLVAEKPKSVYASHNHLPHSRGKKKPRYIHPKKS